MRIGQYRQRITIQQMTPGVDTAGGPTKTFATLIASLPASVLPLNGREAVQAGQTLSTLTTDVRIRYRSDVTVKQRIVWGSRTLDIDSVQDPDGRRQQLMLLCSEAAS